MPPADGAPAVGRDPRHAAWGGACAACGGARAEWRAVSDLLPRVAGPDTADPGDAAGDDPPLCDAGRISTDAGRISTDGGHLLTDDGLLLPDGGRPVDSAGYRRGDPEADGPGLFPTEQTGRERDNVGPATEDRADGVRSVAASDGGSQVGEVPAATPPEGHDGAAIPGAIEQLDAERRNALERTSDGVYLVDEEFRVSYINGAALDILDIEADTLLGEVMWEQFPQVKGTIGEAAMREVLETGDPVSFEQTYTVPGRTYDVRMYPVGDGLAVYFREITELKQRTRELERLERFHGVITDLNEALAAANSRTQIESVVCNRLVGDGPGEFGMAWMGRPDGEGGVEPVASAGPAAHREALETCSLMLSDGPAGTALAADRIVVAHPGDEELDPWTGTALAERSTAVAAVPLSADRTRSVLVLHATSTETPLAVAESTTALEQLQDAVDLAVSAARTRAGLVSDAAIEVEFAIGDGGDSLIGTSAGLDGTVTVGRTTVREDGSYHSVVVASRAAPEWVDAYRDCPGVRSVTDPTEDGRFELTIDPRANAALTVLAANGGNVQRLEVEDGVATVSATFPETTDVRGVYESLAAAFDHVELRAKRESAATGGTRPDPTDDLTGRQFEVLERALDAGYFAWPRENDAGDVAEMLGVSSATFHEHLRQAQRKVFEAVLGR